MTRPRLARRHLGRTRPGDPSTTAPRWRSGVLPATGSTRSCWCTGWRRTPCSGATWPTSSTSAVTRSPSSTCGATVDRTGPRTATRTASAARDLRDVLARPRLAGPTDRSSRASRGAATSCSRAAHDDARWGGVVAVDGGWIHLRPTVRQLRRRAGDALAPPDFGDRDTGRRPRAGSGRWSPTGQAAPWRPSPGNLEVVDGRVRNRLAPRRTTGRSCTRCGQTTRPTSTRASPSRSISWSPVRRASDDVERGTACPAATPPSAGTPTRTTTSICSSRPWSSDQLLALVGRVEGSSA